MALPPPTHRLAVEGVSARRPATRKSSSRMSPSSSQAGQGLGIIGPSGSGKSSLARLLVGVWQPPRGKVRLDGAALDQWSPEALGRHIGYLPQDVELFAGTVAQNIARFDAEPDTKPIIAAAKAAGVHDMILRLPAGYDTHDRRAGLGALGRPAQRVALARALYGDPFLVVLDEPNSNLDAEATRRLTRPSWACASAAASSSWSRTGRARSPASTRSWS